MKITKFFFYAAGIAAFSALSSSCSEDDITGSNSLFNRKSLKVTMDYADGASSTTGAKPQRVGSTVLSNGLTNYWTANDVIWAYSQTESANNKLAGTAADAGQTQMTFASSNATYDDNERMLLFYGGTDLSEAVTEDGVTLTRGNNDNALAIVYGASTDTHHYLCEGNPFVLKRTSAVVSNGELQGGEDNIELNLKDATAKLRISLPAKDAEDVALLKQLTYKVTVNCETEENGSGYPTSIGFEYKGKNQIKKAKGSKAHQIIDEGTMNYGSSLTLTFAPEGADNAISTDKLWNTTTTDVDFCKGYVFIPLAPDTYKKLTVTIEVSNPKNVTGIGDDFCKSYSYEYDYQKSTTKSMLSIGVDDAQVYPIRALWSRN